MIEIDSLWFNYKFNEIFNYEYCHTSKKMLNFLPSCPFIYVLRCAIIFEGFFFPCLVLVYFFWGLQPRCCSKKIMGIIFDHLGWHSNIIIVLAIWNSS